MLTPFAMLQHLKRIQAAYKEQAIHEQTIAALWKAFSEELYRTRKARGITLDKLAEGNGLSKSIISYMENGHRSWSLERATKVINALNGVRVTKKRSKKPAPTPTVEAQEDLVGVAPAPVVSTGVLGPDEEPED